MIITTLHLLPYGYSVTQVKQAGDLTDEMNVRSNGSMVMERS